MLALNEEKLSKNCMCTILIELGADVNLYTKKIYNEQEIQERIDNLSLNPKHRDKIEYYEDAMRKATYVDYDELFEKEMWRILVPEEVSQKIVAVNIDRMSDSTLKAMCKDLRFPLENYKKGLMDFDYDTLRSDVIKIKYLV